MRIGVICPSEIAYRRFMPALQKIDHLQFAGIGICTVSERFGSHPPCQDTVKSILLEEQQKAKPFIENYGGKIFNSYKEITTSDEIDALYIPLPPALHYKWAKLALESGKHVLLEKPSTISAEDTKKLVSIAKSNHLALHENYMFAFHGQLQAIDQIVSSGEIGDIRLYRISFGFPRRSKSDFRYNARLGGGALIDAGGYTIKYASMLLGDTAHIAYAHLNHINEFEVDMYGSGALINENGDTVQIAFGMDNNYKCELEIWGSRGCMLTGRVLTAPAEFVPEITIRKGNEDKLQKLPADDSFVKSILRFLDCVKHDQIRERNYEELIRQAELVDAFRREAVK